MEQTKTVLEFLRNELGRQSSNRLAWWVTGWGIGIVAYFSVLSEPDYWGLLISLAAGPTVLAVIFVLIRRVHPALVMVCFCVSGFGWAGVQATLKAAPVIDKRMYGPVTGQIEFIDRSSANLVRVRLTHVEIGGLAVVDTPAKIRISLSEPSDDLALGDVILLAAHLSPPPAPSEPGGFDFQKFAWFGRIGAVGYSRSPAILWDRPNTQGVWQRVEKIRWNFAQWIMHQMPAGTDGVGVAISVGYRHFLDPDVQTKLRQANLAHLLAISGLHVGLLTGLILLLARWALVFVPGTLGGLGKKRAAALVALGAAAIYLLLSGLGIATQRAFVMAAVALIAVVLNRRVLNVRSIALAALIVLVVAPNAILGPGFQMSFAATLALVLVFAWVTPWGQKIKLAPVRWSAYALLSAAVAGMATAPFAAAHFNMLPHYGVVANFFAIPIMGFVVMPGLILAVLEYAIGLQQSVAGLWVMHAGLWAIVAIAEVVSGWPASVTYVNTPPPYVLALMSGSLLFLGLWVGWFRILGAIGACVAVALWAMAPRPDILVDGNGALISARGPDGRAMSAEIRAGFVARSWLENDGDTATQQQAYARAWPDWQVDWAGLEALSCLEIAARRNQKVDKPCKKKVAAQLRRTGAVAGYRDQDGGWVWKTVKDDGGRRLWNDAATRRKVLQ